MTAPSTLLTCTVGGSPEPIVAALKHWRPMRVRFVHTSQTRDDIAMKILPKVREEGVDLDAGRYDLFELPDGQDRFDHTASENQLESDAKSANDPRVAFGAAIGGRGRRGTARLARHLEELGKAILPSRHHVLELSANAKRRKDEGGADDAVARFYRAIEAIAQVTRKERHSIEHTHRFDCVPDAGLEKHWTSALSLADVDFASLLSFPTLAEKECKA